MRYRSLSLAVSAVAATVLLPAGVAAAAPGTAAVRPAAGCTWRLDTRLPLPAGLNSATINATNGASDFAGSAWNFSVSDLFHAVVWRGGQVSLLPTPVGSGSMAFGMNSHGDVVGVLQPLSGPSVPVLWRNGQVIKLAVGSPDISANPRDINDAGVIVGEAFLPTDGNRAIAWSADQPGKFSYVASPGTESFLTAVTETGTVVGHYSTGTGGFAATGTVAGGLQPLPLPAGSDSAYSAAASGAFVAGGAHGVGAENTHAVLWQNGTPTDLSKEDTAPTGVNSAGTVVGNSFANSRLNAVVWSGGVEQTLPWGISTGPAPTSAATGVISETNAVGGWLNTSLGTSQPVVWHCR